MNLQPLTHSQRIKSPEGNAQRIKNTSPSSLQTTSSPIILFSPISPSTTSSTSSISSIQSRLKKISYNSQLYKNDSGVFDQISNEVSDGLKIDSQYRFNVLRGVQSFNHVSDEDIHVLAQSLEEIYYNEGDYIIRQDEKGDALFILEKGLVQVSRESIIDNERISTNITQLSNDTLFGEVSLLTEEVRSASIYVISNRAKCLKLSKTTFDEILSRKKNFQEKSKMILGHNIISKLPFLKNLSPTVKALVTQNLNIISFNEDMYIVRQGSYGQTFYILIEGELLVTQDRNINGVYEEVEINRLIPGDYFGELSLIDSSSKRSANIKTLSAVTCLSLTRAEFQQLILSDNSNKQLFENRRTSYSRKKKEETSTKAIMSKLRRITAFDLFNVKHSIKADNLFPRFGKFIAESLWLNMFHVVYRSIQLNTSKLQEAGDIVLNLKESNPTRDGFISGFQTELNRILTLLHTSRTSAECDLIMSVMNQRNSLKEKVCREMPPFMYRELCMKAEYISIAPLKKVIDCRKRGEAVCLILRGSVRTFSVATVNDKGQAVGLEYEGDYCPGDCIGEEGIVGLQSANITALALTPCVLLKFGQSSFKEIKSDEIEIMTVEEKVDYLKLIPTFKKWSLFDLHELGKVLRLETIEKNFELLKKGMASDKLYFIVYGTMSLIKKTMSSSRTLSCLSKYDYLGESCLINFDNKKREERVVEEYYCISRSKVGLLVLSPEHYSLMNKADTIKTMTSLFQQKKEFRDARSDTTFKVQQSTLKHFTFQKTSPNSYLPSLPSLSPESPLLLSDSQDSEHRVQKPKTWWENNDTSNKDLEDLNMLFDSTVDPVMMMATMKGSNRDRNKLMADIQEKSNSEKVVRYKAKSAAELVDDGFSGPRRRSTMSQSFACGGGTESSNDSIRAALESVGGNSSRKSFSGVSSEQLNSFLAGGLKSL